MLRSSQAPVLLLLHPQLSFGAKHPPANESGGGGGEGANGAATSWILDTAHPGVGTLVCTGLEHWAGDTGLSLLQHAGCRYYSRHPCPQSTGSPNPKVNMGNTNMGKLEKVCFNSLTSTTAPSQRSILYSYCIPCSSVARISSSCHN